MPAVVRISPDRPGRSQDAADRGISAAASRLPASATAKVTSGAPPSGANHFSGDSAWLNAHRPHGKPPNGNRSRTASSVTQSAATPTGHQRNRCTSGSAAAIAAVYQVSANTRISQGTAPT